MISSPQVPLHRLVLSLSAALDYSAPEIPEHQQRVAYMATKIAQRMGFKGQELLNVFIAAALHDLGSIAVANRSAMGVGQLDEARRHAQRGYSLLKTEPLFARAAEIVGHLYVSWADGADRAACGEDVYLASHIISLADAIERMIDREVPILEQSATISQSIASMSGAQMCPDCVDAFLEVAGSEGFWLDVVHQRLYIVLPRQMDWPLLTLDEQAIERIAEMFARVVDAASQWTMVHTAGVAAVAVALAQRMRFSPREQSMMRAAAYLHDLGKLAVPIRVLNKFGKLDAQEWACIKLHPYHTFRLLESIGGMPQVAEWAAFHHERLDGTGYPFRHRGKDLTLGSRVMAVADVCAAIGEDRGYRKRMQRHESMDVLDKLVDSGGLDGDVVGILKQDFDLIKELRTAEMAEYARKQNDIREYPAYSTSRQFARQS